ncbi:MAG: homoserine O-succinyltransferase [Caulobacteraceae bacterium]|nr:homoserine O-succinyltransferase [Caulobacteraceae bacterium]
MADGTLLANDLRPSFGAPRPRIEIALVNNMPDAALQATERQFASLVEEAARDDFEVNLSLYAMPETPRGDLARASMRERYATTDALKQAGTDALIVTGAEPLADDLRDEPYWSALATLVDWARTSTVSAVWSCLAAHAAVLHLDGIVRQPLASKCSGVFTFERTGEAPLTAGLPGLVRIPHSRRNALPPAQLEARGYRVLTRSPRAGADVFVRDGQSLFVFLQGHPEYDADSLLREYCRDVGRYLRGQQAEYPHSPHGYFDAETERSFRALAVRARSDRDPRLVGWSSEIATAMRPARPWRAQAVMLFRNWLELVAAGKAATTGEPARRLQA